MEERNSQTLLRFLLSFVDNQRPITHLFLLGDIFDLWVGGHEYFAKKWKPLLDCIQKLIQEKNVQVYFIEGNHDLHIDPYWVKTLHAKVYTESLQLSLGPWKIHLEHGDLINKNDIKYLRYRAIVRSTALRFLGCNLPGFFWDYIGNKMSQKSSQYSRVFREGHAEELRSMIRTYAQQLNGVDYIFTGHFHVRDDFPFQKNGKTVHSINLGSWQDIDIINNDHKPHPSNQTFPPKTTDINQWVYYLQNTGGNFIEINS